MAKLTIYEVFGKGIDEAANPTEESVLVATTKGMVEALADGIKELKNNKVNFPTVVMITEKNGGVSFKA